MLGMAKKKRENEAADRSADRHAPHKMMRVPLDYHKLLKVLSRRHSRSLTAELKLALDDYFQKYGLEPPPKPPEDED
jgi:hypothetical protein